MSGIRENYVENKDIDMSIFKNMDVGLFKYYNEISTDNFIELYNTDYLALERYYTLNNLLNSYKINTIFLNIFISNKENMSNDAFILCYNHPRINNTVADFLLINLNSGISNNRNVDFPFQKLKPRNIQTSYFIKNGFHMRSRIITKKHNLIDIFFYGFKYKILSFFSYIKRSFRYLLKEHTMQILTLCIVLLTFLSYIKINK